MNDKVYKAKRALAGCGDFEMTADGELTRLDVGRDGVLHIPKGCKGISKDFIIDSVYNNNAEIRFCENAEIRVCGNVFLKVNPYVSNKISDITVDLRYTDNYLNSAATATYWSYRVINRLKNVQVKYIFSNELFAKQVAKLYYYFKFSDCIGWKFTDKNGKLVVFIGSTDITKKFCNVNILEDILREFSYEVVEEFMQKFNNDVEKMGVEVSNEIRSAKRQIKEVK